MPGGNTAPVVRVGDTVRRVAGPWTPRVAALMTGLRRAGLELVPEHLGVDERGREVVAFVEGDVPIYPLPQWVWADEVLVDVGRAVRAVHDAAAGLDLPRDGWRVPAVEPVEVVTHGDVAPYNCVFASGRLVALIDWDHAVPAPRLRDLGSAAYRFVSLTPAGHPDGLDLPPAEQWRRVQVLADAYGGVSAVDVVRWACRHLEDLIATAADPEHVRLYEGDVVHVRSLLAGAVDAGADRRDDQSERDREQRVAGVDQHEDEDQDAPEGGGQPGARGHAP